MPKPFGTVVDLNVIQKRMGRLKKACQENRITDAKALAASINTDWTAIKALIDAATTNQDLSESPTLDLDLNP